MSIHISSEINVSKDAKKTSKVKQLINRTISNETLERLQTLKPSNLFLDEFVNNMLDHYTGTNCEHEHRCLYLKLHLKDNGFLNVSKSMDVLRDAHFGQGNPDIVEVCEDCLRMKRIFEK